MPSAEHQEFMGSVGRLRPRNGMVFKAMACGAVAVVPRDPDHEPFGGSRRGRSVSFDLA